MPKIDYFFAIGKIKVQKYNLYMLFYICIGNVIFVCLSGMLYCFMIKFNI